MSSQAIKHITIFALAAAVLAVTLHIASGHSFGEESTVIHMYSDRYEPADIVIPRGGKVIFENIEGNHWPASNIHPTHRAYPGSDIDKCETDEEGRIFDACRTMEEGESYEFTFNEAGEWRYHDHVNPQIKGKITVEPVEGFDTETYTENPRTLIQKIGDLVRGIWAKLLALFGGGETLPQGITYIEDLDDSTVIEFYGGGVRDDDLLYSYIKDFGPDKAVKNLHDNQQQYGNCHQAAHDTGNMAYKVYGADAFKLCGPECHSGCYHGATEMFFREHGTASLEEDVDIICGDEDNPFYSHQCVHGIGHGLMAWSDYDIFEALENCDKLSTLHNSCYTGVYMENIVGGLAPDQGHFTKYLSDDPHFPCNIVDDKYKGSCYFYQTSRMVTLFKGDFGKVAEACMEAPEEYRHSCFASMGRDVGGASGRVPETAIESCSVIESGDYRRDCLSGAVQDFFWDPSGQDGAIAFCRLLSDQAEKQTCYQTIFYRAPDVLLPGDISQFCEKAEEEYKARCIEIASSRLNTSIIGP